MGQLQQRVKPRARPHVRALPQDGGEEPADQHLPLPPELLRTQLESGSWEFVLLRRQGGGPPVAWAAARPAGREYRALYCGVDYDDFPAGEINPYRQLLWQLVRRAGQLGCERLHLGMGAGLEKTRLGATASPALALVRADDAFAATRLQEFVTQTALRSADRS
ncbi:GNAT family N-acetyltransferase [Nannocystis pusilla]|uniref:GNAT family N-acetyltransferase n=1 Tax=Nannocystis pusilla TaxID=889268 RepID=UPI003B7ED0FF